LRERETDSLCVERANVREAGAEQERAEAYNYFTIFGERLIDIFSKCQQASGAIAEANAEEQQAEAKHAANVNTALTAAALVLVGTALVASNVGAASATRPPVVQQNNYFYGR